MCALIWVLSNERGSAGGILMMLNLIHKLNECLNVLELDYSTNYPRPQRD